MVRAVSFCKALALVRTFVGCIWQRDNRKLTEITFRQQIDLTITQIENLYWDLVNAYQDEQVKQRSLAFAETSLDQEQKQLELKAVPAMDVMKAADRSGHAPAGPDHLQRQPCNCRNR